MANSLNFHFEIQLSFVHGEVNCVSIFARVFPITVVQINFTNGYHAARNYEFYDG